MIWISRSRREWVSSTLFHISDETALDAYVKATESGPKSKSLR